MTKRVPYYLLSYVTGFFFAVANTPTYGSFTVVTSAGYGELARNAFGTVTNASDATGLAHVYGYDHIGNRVFYAVNAVTNTYSANNLNQYIGLSYDADGNLLSDGSLSHTWDPENRLVRSEPAGIATNGAVRLVNRYDHRHRRIQKCVEVLTGRGAGYPMDPSQPGSWDAVKTHTFVYDGWNLALETIAYTNGTVDRIEYVWGLDLSGTLQGAGGVGGLLFEKRNGQIYIPLYDANGNVTDYVDAYGTVRGHFEYDAFGNTVAMWGDLAHSFKFRFSTKYWDDETRSYYYGYRHYAPKLGCWTSRDPVEERGGNDLYEFCGNDPVNNWDYLGRISIAPVDDSPVVSYESTPADKGYMSFFASAFIVFDDADNAALSRAGGGMLVHGKRVTFNLRHCSTGETLKESQAVQKRFNVTANFSDPGGKSWPATDGQQYIYFNLADRKRVSKCYKGTVEVNAKWVLYPRGVSLPPIGDNMEDVLSGSQDWRDTHGGIGSTSGWPNTRAGGYISSGWFTFTIRFSCDAQPSVTATITPLYPYALGRPGRGGSGNGYDWPTE